ncbi:MAG TPA: M20/M25/M40 family metallo-hydrolase [Candidatus Eremiobacteraceae bacterium]|nr:M20/M25/M40 family metallo-hydrolase [Candidatus Eremiobacteraceae bacterium]
MKQLCGVAFSICIAALIFVTAAPVQAQDSANIDVLRKLVTTYGVSGYEGPVRRQIESMLPSWAHPKTDAMGNLVLEVGSGAPSMLFIAHMDEIGYYITDITPDGYLRVEAAGGFWPGTFEGREVVVHTASSDVPGVTATKSIHLTQGDDPPFTNGSIYVDVGVSSRAQAEALGIRLLDSITIRKNFIHLAGDRYAGRSMDDRFGCTTLVQAVRSLDPSKLHGTVIFVWSVQEELGTRGAAAVAKSFRPDFVFPVDMFVTSDTPLESPRKAYAPIGQGAVMRALDQSNLSPPEWNRRILAWASRKHIALQIGATGGGNDGENFWSQTTYVIPFGIPIRYSHSMEVIDAHDLDSMIEIVKGLISDSSWRQ